MNREKKKSQQKQSSFKVEGGSIKLSKIKSPLILDSESKTIK